VCARKRNLWFLEPISSVYRHILETEKSPADFFVFSHFSREIGFPMSLQKQNSHKLTVEAARGASNSRHERNRVRGMARIMNTVVTYLVSSSFI